VERLANARRLYERGLFKEAAAALRWICSDQPLEAEAWWLLGAVTRHLDQTALSDDAFARASALLPRQMPLPHRVSPGDFGRLVERAKKALRAPPSSLRQEHFAIARNAVAADVRTHIASLPAAELIEAGASPHARWTWSGEDLTLYQVNHENAAGSDRGLVRLIAQSLVAAVRSRAAGRS
jgi:hypothetical protein